MRILIIEDEDVKYEAFVEAFTENGITSDMIVRIDNLFDLLKHSGNLGNYDLCLIDFFLPFRSGENEPQNCMQDVLQTLDASDMSEIPVLAITRYASDPNFDDSNAKSRGILAYDFDKKEIWKVAVQSFLAKARGKHKYDFIGVLALEAERQGFNRIPGIQVTKKKVAGLDAWEVRIDYLRGCLFCLPKMGLVDAAIATSKIMENFSPKVAFMSGICGGSSDTEMGQLLVTDFCWEYQSGKWIADGFQSDAYQEGISESLKTDLSMFFKNNPNILSELEQNITGIDRPSKMKRPEMAIFSSGSAVVASKKQMEKIKEQHRKVKGIDMEIFAFHRCMNLIGGEIQSFSCKVVVDKADEQKDDRLHSYGCALSAAASLRIIREILIPERQTH